MLWADTLRGFDSTGICYVDKTNTVYTYKRALAGPDFLSTRQYRALSLKVDPMVMLGHNRAATRGTVTDDNAHPFRFGNITLTHNGTLTNHKSLKDGTGFDVDSAYIAHSIHKYGVEETIKNIQGAFALVWYNSEDKKIHVIRNKERPLHYGFVKGEDTLVYSSEPQLLSWVIERNKKELDEETYFEFEEGVLYSIDPENPTEAESRKLELYKPPVTHVNRTYHGQNSYPRLVDHTAARMPPADAIKKLGYELRGTLEMNLAVVNTKSRLVEMVPAPSSKVPKDYDVECRYYMKDNREEMGILEHTEDTIMGTISGCQHVPGTDRFIVYIAELTDFIEETVGLDDPQPNYDNEQEQEESFADSVLLFRGPGNHYVSTTAFKKLVQDGCVDCGSGIDLDSHLDVVWTKDNKPICAACTKRWLEDSTPGWMDM